MSATGTKLIGSTEMPLSVLAALALATKAAKVTAPAPAPAPATTSTSTSTASTTSTSSTTTSTRCCLLTVQSPVESNEMQIHRVN